MVLFLYLYFVFHALAWLGVAWVYRRWVERPGGYRWKSVLGMVIVYCCLGTQLIPALGVFGATEQLEDREQQYWVGLLFLGSATVLVFIGLIRFGSCMHGQASLGQCPTEGDPMAPGQTRERFRAARKRLGGLQRALGEGLGFTVPLVLTESLPHLVLVGLNPHRIYVPFELAAGGEDVQALLAPLAQWATHRRYRAYMFLWWLSQFHLLLLPLTAGIRRALELELAREAGGDPCQGPRYRAAINALKSVPAEADADRMGLAPSGPLPHPVSTHLWPVGFVPIALLTLGCAWSAWAVGFINPSEFIRFIMRRQIIGYSLHIYHPEVAFRAIPGEGGLLPDGILIDTTRDEGQFGSSSIRLPLGLLAVENYVPFGAEALRIKLDWRVLERSDLAQDAPALKLNCSEQTAIDHQGQQRLLTFYARNLILAAHVSDQGTLDIPIRLHPAIRSLSGSTDVIYGPILYIPKGWKIEFRQYLIEKMKTEEVPPMPEGESERFVAWYRRNGLKPAPLDLTWQAIPGWS